MTEAPDDLLQRVRVEACRLAAQILAGTGAEPPRVMHLVSVLAVAMLPTAEVKITEPEKKKPFSVIPGDKPEA